jgi:hypothetical protein
VTPGRGRRRLLKPPYHGFTVSFQRKLAEKFPAGPQGGKIVNKNVPSRTAAEKNLDIFRGEMVFRRRQSEIVHK